MRIASFLVVAVLASARVAPLAAQAHGKPDEKKAAPAQHHAPHWTYEGAEGPRAWGQLDEAWKACSIGHEQSPIDLGGTIQARQLKIEERFTATPFVLFHNGHTVQAALEKPSTLTIDGGAYDAIQFHFHHPSEHTVKGKAYPAELHLVHRNAKGELAVLGIFIAIAPDDNPAFEALIARLPAAAGDSVKFESPVDLASVIDNRADAAEALFRYAGSLTTPPCSEGVRWTVRERPMTASFRQMQALTKVLGENARPVQPLYDRR